MRDVMQDRGLTDAYANFHFLLFHCNYLIQSNTTLPLTERHSDDLITENHIRVKVNKRVMY